MVKLRAMKLQCFSCSFLAAFVLLLTGCDTLLLYRVQSDRYSTVAAPIQGQSNRYSVDIKGKDVILYVSANQFNRDYGLGLEIQNSSKQKVKYEVQQVTLKSKKSDLTLGVEKTWLQVAGDSHKREPLAKNYVLEIDPGERVVLAYSLDHSPGIFRRSFGKNIENEMVLLINGLKIGDKNIPVALDLLLDR